MEAASAWYERAVGHDDPLALDRETMRELGYRTVDMLVDRLLDESAPPLRRATPAEMRARLGGPPPDGPEPFDELLRRLDQDVLPFTSRGEHPGFFAFVPFAGTWPGALGDFIASACNVYAGSWMEAAGPTQLELNVLEWFRQWMGLPESAGGTLLTGGSTANMTALACARETLVGAMSDRIVGYVSDQAHSSLARGARILGFRPDQIRVLPGGRDLRLAPETVLRAVEADSRAGRIPFFLSANAGATNTGVVDPLRELGALCRERGIWFHVDGAYGGFAMLTERGRSALDGIDLADSVTLDPHKWLYQSYECGCLLVRDASLLRRAFEMTPAYLLDARPSTGEVNLADLGIQLTRTTRAIKVWLSLRAFGLDAFRGAIDRCLDLAETAVARIEESPAFELAAPPSLSVVCFRRRFEGAGVEEEDRRNAALVAALDASGLGLISSTRVAGRYVLRMCILGHATGPDDVERVLSFLEQTEVAVEPSAAAVAYERHPDVGESWLAGAESGAADLDRLPIFRSLHPDEVAQLAGDSLMIAVREGETVIEQWEGSRDFYVVLSGSVDVVVDGARVRTLGAGEFFGELAALDWGGGFGYPRLASVVAASPARLLRVPCGGPEPAGDRECRCRAGRAPGGPRADARPVDVIDPLERWRDLGDKPDYAGLLTFGGLPYTQDPARARGRRRGDRRGADRRSRLGSARSALRAARDPRGQLSAGAAPGGEGRCDARPPHRRLRRRAGHSGRPGTHACGDRGDGGAGRRGGSDPGRPRRRPLDLGGRHPRVRAAARRGWARPPRHAHGHRHRGLRRRALARHADVPARRGGIVDPLRYVQIGLRGYWPGEREFAWQEERGIESYFMHDVRELGIAAVVARTIERVGHGPVFLSVDIDVLDPAFAPGTGTPEPGGMTSADVLWACRELAASLDLIGADLVEVIPTGVGSADVTALVAERIVREILTGMALRRATGPGG